MALTWIGGPDPKLRKGMNRRSAQMPGYWQAVATIWPMEEFGRIAPMVVQAMMCRSAMSATCWPQLP